MKRFPTLLAAMLAIASCTPSASRQEAWGTFTNPILGGDYPDPSIMREGEDYYLTNSSFDYNPGLIVFHSTDLVNWEPISCALKTYLGSVWAPDISKVGDEYRIYFTVHGHGNWVVTASSPYGPWSDPVDLHVNQIDPCPAFEDGQGWLFLSGGNRIKLTPDGMDTVPGTFEHVYDGWIYPEEWITEGMCLEGPKLKKIGPWWYFISAEGGTAGPPTSHMVAVARAKTLDGPWENSPVNPLVHTYNDIDRWWSRGHGSLIDTPDGRWYIVYHAYENGYTGLGRQTLLEPVELGEDGWFHPVKGLDIAGPMPLPLPSSGTIDRKARLGEFRVGLDWKYYKDFDPSRATVGDGVLTLKCTGTSPADSAPLMFVAGDHAYEFSAEIDMSPGAIAGLVLYYDSDFYAGAGCNATNTFRYRKDKGQRGDAHGGDCHLWLKVRNDHQVVTGYTSQDGVNWHKMNWGHEISGYNHNTCYYFQSVLPGLMAAGEGEVRFSNFKYTKLAD